MVKPNVHIIILLVAFLLSINGIAQSEFRDTALLSVENNYKPSNSFEKKIVVISIFNDNNPEEIKKLDKLAEKYKNSNVSFVSVTDNLNDDEYNFLKNQILHYQHLSKNENKRIFNKYQTGMYKVFPIHVILNKEGEVTFKKKGTVNNIEEKLAKRINRLLKTNPSKIQAQRLQYTSR
jgi:histone acetyltransferase (RNA polymerase elongator complex component)